MSSDNAPTVGQVDPVLLRQAFGSFATGVTVVTVGGANPHGMTANSFASVSLDPPLVLVCVDREAVMHHCLTTTRRFGVSVLTAKQEGVARHFANRHRPLGSTQFDGIRWLPGPLTGSPLITGALAHFECEFWRAYDGGDHTIFVGGLLGMQWRAEEQALLFFKGRFDQLDRRPSEVTT